MAAQAWGARLFTRRQLSLTVSLRSRQAVKKVVKKVVKKPVKKPVKKAVKKVVKKTGGGKTAKTFAGQTSFGEGPLGTAKTFFSEENWVVQAITTLTKLPSSAPRQSDEGRG